MKAIPDNSPSGMPRTCWSELSPAERGSSNIWPVVRPASRPSRNVLGASGRYDGSRPSAGGRTTQAHELYDTSPIQVGGRWEGKPPVRCRGR